MGTKRHAAARVLVIRGGGVRSPRTEGAVSARAQWAGLRGQRGTARGFLVGLLRSSRKARPHGGTLQV